MPITQESPCGKTTLVILERCMYVAAQLLVQEDEQPAVSKVSYVA